MSTTPTNQPVPSESPRDLKFNAGKIDEFVTSMERQYIDRFGGEHYTIEGLRWLAQQAMAAFGYITLDSFEDGNTLTLPNQVLRLEATGEYYRWGGVFPKNVPAGSTPDTTGGVGIGAWVGVGDASLRRDLSLNTGASLIGTSSGETVQSSIDNLNYRTQGYVNLWEFIPPELHQYLSDLDESNTHVPSVNDYLDAATAYCEDRGVGLFIPAGYYMLTREWGLPKGVRVEGVGPSSTLLLGSASFSGERLVHCDYAGQEQFQLRNMWIHGLNAPNTIGLHIGACRNSAFEFLTVTDSRNGSFLVKPTATGAADVENFLINKCWTLNTNVPIKIISNKDIGSVGSTTAGNITDGTVSNCQLVSWDGVSAASAGISTGGTPIEIHADLGTLVFGVKVDRCFTATIKNAHLKLTSDGADKNLYDCTISNINSESQVVGGGLDSNNTAPGILLNGAGVQCNNFISAHCGSQGAGIQIGDAIDNTFYDVTFSDNSAAGNNNVWIYCNSASKGNRFLDMKSGGILQAVNPLNASIYNNFLGIKIGDDGTGNEFQFRDATSTPSVILNRGKVFVVSGGKLTNFPDVGGDATNWSWAIQPSGALRVSIPINTGGSKSLPFGAVAAKMGFKFVYNIVSGTPTVLNITVGGTTIPASTLTADSSTHSVSAVVPASGAGVMTITANASATAATVIDIYDIGVCANQIPMRSTIKQSIYIE
ncbi:tail fiber/spike domain-containing protein [Citrobacter freundii]|uniref:tail fiber/spike domain-containing protein n=1 Tax=Citrobacter freundii TaxID=546 RepID=UPI0028C0292E|nr:hypothetical protein [Citrobacter freundii]